MDRSRPSSSPGPARHRSAGVADGLPAGPRRAVVAAILALHGLAAWGLLQVDAVRTALIEAAPLFVDLLAPPAPEPPPAPAPPPPPKPLPRKPPPPAPLVAAPPVPAPAPFVAPASEPEPAPPAPPVAVAVPAPPAPPAPPPAPAPPKEIPASAIQYLDWPDVVYPPVSRRLGETGVAVVAVYVDAEGQPRSVQLQQSSGFARLDEAALAGVRKARFKPYIEAGRPTAGWARIPIAFDLEK